MNGKRCKICRNSKNNKIYIVHERMLNNGNTFQYLFCDRCGTLQLIDEVVDIGKYYQEDYHQGPVFLLLTTEEATEYGKAKVLRAGEKLYEDDHYVVYLYGSREELMSHAEER